MMKEGATPTDMGEQQEKQADILTQPSVVLPQWQDPERDFYELVVDGNVAKIRLFLIAHPNFNVNATNFQGLTALHVAVQQKNVAMVEQLLSHPDIDPVDTHLYAIKENQMKIVIMILNKLNELSPGLEFASVTHSADFPDEATPLAVASQYGHYELIQYLIQERHHVLVKPHSPSCNCEDVCKRERDNYDSLTLAKKSIFMYKAVSNPAYICQTSYDPILQAFELSYELKKAAAFSREFYNYYKDLSNEMSQFGTDLIDCARAADEVEQILKQKAGFHRSSKFLYPRLLLALDYKQKSFVAHPNVQELIQNKWLADWYEWHVRKTWLKCLTVLPRIFMMPVIVVVILLLPNSKIAKFWQTPVNKFLHYVASYLVFLLIVFLISNIDKSEQLRGPPNTGLEIILAIYVISYSCAAVRLCIMQGTTRYFRAPWNWYEVIMLLLFMLTFLFWIAAAVDIRLNNQRELERKYWYKYDPTLVAEGIYCLATIMAFFRLMFICQLDYHLGPLQISLGKMINDVSKFIIIFAIIILAFSTGLCRLYQYYTDMVQVDDDTKMKVQQVNSFVNFASTLKTLFWALFCMSPMESAEVIIENLPGDNEFETIINTHNFTEIIGYVAFGSFQLISVILLLNIFIACLSSTFTKVTDNVIVEWTFGRTEVYVDFMLLSALPPPFNILPTISCFKAIVEYMKILIKPSPEKRARWDFKYCCYIVGFSFMALIQFMSSVHACTLDFFENLEEEKNEHFAIVMMQLVQRYFRQNIQDKDEMNVEQLRKELTELRNLLQDALSPA